MDGFYDQLTEYTAHILERSHAGKIDETKAARLLNKLGEWLEHAEKEADADALR